MSPEEESGPRILALDTDVLVHWAMAGAPHHRAVRKYLEREVRQGGWRLGITQQTLNELIHVVTDSRRFENPLPMKEALRMSRELWHGEDVERLLPTVEVHDRVCELMERFKLGRKRILDTALAATVEMAGVSRLATLNARDFALFPFLELVDPTVEVGDRETGPEATDP